jgi:DNA-binding NarL/FixJ family response regulator
MGRSLQYKLPASLLIGLFYSICICAVPHGGALPDTPDTLLSRAQELEAEALLMMQQMEEDNAIDSLSTINPATLQNQITAYSLQVEANQLKTDYHVIWIDSLQKGSLPDSIPHEVIKKVQNHSKNLVDEINMLMTNLRNETNTDTIISLYQQILNKQTKLLAWQQITLDLHLASESIKQLFTQPYNVEKIAAHYQLTPENIENVLAQVADKTTLVYIPPDTIRKGYSPFTSEYKEFIFEADSIANASEELSEQAFVKKSDSLALSTIHIDTALQKELSVVWDAHFQQLKQDSLFISAVKDSLFPHELITMYDKSSLKDYWNIYLNQWTTQPPLETITKQPETIESDSSSSIVNAQLIIDETPGDSILSTFKSSTLSIIKDHPEDTTYYYVQISASREALTESFIRRFYKGDDSIYVRLEDNWYKYQIGKTPSYQKAKITLRQTAIKGAFIVPYSGSQKQELWQTISNRRKVVKNLKLEGLTYVVQLAASRDPLSEVQLQMISKNTSGIIREVIEDNWHKYQLVVGPSFEEAKTHWLKAGKTTSFIVPYLNNEKISMIEAFKKQTDN